MPEVKELVAELKAKAWQSSSRRNSAGGLSSHKDHVCWRAATILDRLDREAMALICMKWRLDCDQGDWPEDKARECVAAISEPHYGDCTKAPMTCLRCEAEAAFRQADAIISHIQGGGNAE